MRDVHPLLNQALTGHYRPKYVETIHYDCLGYHNDNNDNGNGERTTMKESVIESDATAMQNPCVQKLVRSFALPLFVLLAHAFWISSLHGQVVQPDSGQPSSPGKQTRSDRVAGKPKSKSGFPAIETALAGIAKEAGVKMQIRKTGYFNPRDNPHSTGDPGCYFRFPLSQNILKKITSKLHLIPHKNTHDNVRRILTQFPRGWPDLNLDDCEWYAQHHNVEDSNLGDLMVMVADKKSKNVFLLVARWDYTP